MAAVIVHGGAYTVPDAAVEASLEGCRLAAEKAYKLLESGNSALDAGKKLSGSIGLEVQFFLFPPAVEVAVRSLEDDPVYDAGHGSVLNKAGQVQMDSIIIDGSMFS